MVWTYSNDSYCVLTCLLQEIVVHLSSKILFFNFVGFKTELRKVPIPITHYQQLYYFIIQNRLFWPIDLIRVNPYLVYYPTPEKISSPLASTTPNDLFPGRKRRRRRRRSCRSSSSSGTWTWSWVLSRTPARQPTKHIKINIFCIHITYEYMQLLVTVTALLILWFS